MQGTLEHEGENDYRLNEGSCWIGVGKAVVYVVRQADGTAKVEVYDESSPEGVNEPLEGFEFRTDR